jgi:hypothetical protein
MVGLFVLACLLFKSIQTVGYVRCHNDESIVCITTQKKTVIIEIQDKKSKGSLQWQN